MNVNQSRIFAYLGRYGPCPRQLMADELGMPRSTVYDNMKPLLESGRIAYETRQLKRWADGRPATGAPTRVFYLVEEGEQ